ncbi:uncharacterized protein G2W53_014565 [Senna tora]|uniref:Uncharacterized protein n=1 Tax=Senna tora TaxID=362788 RepID=A0A835C8A4_9FABA|nr:uncharacterized protein G2W53_014565 [Senna tora]
MTSHTFHAIRSPNRALNPIGFQNTTRSEWLDITSHAFHAITSPIPALNPLGFQKRTRSERHNFTRLPCNHESHSSIKSTRIPKDNAKRSARLDAPSMRSRVPFGIQSTRIFKYNEKGLIQSGVLAQNVVGHDLTYLPCDHESYSSIKFTRIPKYNTKRSI